MDDFGGFASGDVGFGDPGGGGGIGMGGGWGGRDDSGGGATLADMLSDAMQGRPVNVPGLYDISNPEDFKTMEMLGWDRKEAPQIGQSQLEGRMAAAAHQPPGLFGGLSWRDLPIVGSLYDLISPVNPFPGPEKGLGAKGISALSGASTGLLGGGASMASKGLGMAGKASRAASNVMTGMSVPEAALRGAIPGVAFDLADMFSSAMRGVPPPANMTGRLRQEDYPYQDIDRLNRMQKGF